VGDSKGIKPILEVAMESRQKSTWIRRVTFVLVFLSTLACTVFGWDLTGGTTQGPQNAEVTRIVQETVIVPGPERVITSAPVIVEITRQVEVTRIVEVPVTVIVPDDSGPPIALQGVWYNPSTHDLTTILWQDGTFEVVSIVDTDDGEVMNVTSSNWNGSRIRWTYYVPSTTYNVTFTMTSLAGDKLNTEWFNDHAASGTRTFQRQ
jgi:hypothetical protein